MKKIITPKVEEKSIYICDATGIEMEENFFDSTLSLLGCTIKLNSNYKSLFDGVFNNELHLSEQVTKEIIEFLADKYLTQRLLKLKHYSQE